MLAAFANSGNELTVTIENAMLSELTNPQAALLWVSTHIKPYCPATITIIAVGNEVDATDLLANLVPAMSNIEGALSQLGLDSYIKPGPTSERNFGVYQPNGTRAYNLGNNRKPDVLDHVCCFVDFPRI
ncbi:putative glucan endo-1,3-beta-D-glucosidase [Rosa chinensis]|uniref:glucan endo-1,3-beta-D-glucosidase n=1 Tax=Rosa chinensis TaxID=74649 RepID=A0A2P6Q3I8_ROSCH|nr:putative glucan endo-1,3-beta-D-glucosidase [Rosa chinensis]